MNTSALSGQEERCFSDLSARLQAAGYEATGVRPVLGRGILDITPDLLPGLVRRCRDAGTPAASLMAFWLLQEPLARAELEAWLGSDTVRALGGRDLIGEEAGLLHAKASLYPLLGGHFFADTVLPGPGLGLPWLTRADYVLALATPRTAGEQAVDLNAGPGVQTILHAEDCQLSWGRAATPETAELCRLNAVLNRLEGRCHFVGFDCEIPGTFDRITGRMPFLPHSQGEEATLVRQLAERLQVGGTLVLATRHFTPDQPLLDRVERWLGGPAGWGLAELSYGSHYLVLDNPKASLEDLNASIFGVQHGFEGAAECLLLIRRLAPTDRGWRASRGISFPQESISDLIASWLDAQQRFSAKTPAWKKEWRPRWSHIQRLCIDPRGELGLARYLHGFDPAVLDPGSAYLLDQIDGHKNAGDLLKAYAARWGHSQQAARPEVARRLAELARRALIQ